MYTYKAQVVRVVDGDTVVLNIDLGFKIYHIMSCRLSGINAPELNSKDEAVKLAAIKSKAALMSMLLVGEWIEIESKKLDKYGRAVVKIDYVNDIMIEQGHAVKYEG